MAKDKRPPPRKPGGRAKTASNDDPSPASPPSATSGNPGQDDSTAAPGEDAAPLELTPEEQAAAASARAKAVQEGLHKVHQPPTWVPPSSRQLQRFEPSRRAAADRAARLVRFFTGVVDMLADPKAGKGDVRESIAATNRAWEALFETSQETAARIALIDCISTSARWMKGRSIASSEVRAAMAPARQRFGASWAEYNARLTDEALQAAILAWRESLDAKPGTESKWAAVAEAVRSAGLGPVDKDRLKRLWKEPRAAAKEDPTPG